MKKKRSQDEIMASWKGGFDNPLVSISCITYNHESFIENAIEGFLCQETNFPFEILIYDDASTDKTAHIIKEYEIKYPKLIKPVYQKENQYSKGVKISIFNFERAKGKYVALCEGDDYWCDRNKLQIQADFLNLYNDYSIVYHDSDILYNDSGKLVKGKLKNIYKKDASEMDLKTWFKITTQSVMVRRLCLVDFPRKAIFFGGDKFICSVAGCYGRGKYLNNIQNSIFRVHAEGVNRGEKDTKVKLRNYLRTRIYLFGYFYDKSDYEVVDYYVKDILKITLRYCSAKPMFMYRLLSILIRKMLY